MKILFSLDVSNQRQVDFCNRILKILDNKDYNNDITLICKSQNHLNDYLYIPPVKSYKTEEAEIILTYGKTGLSHISQFARKSNIPIIHFINTEYLKDEYLSEDPLLSGELAVNYTLGAQDHQEAVCLKCLSYHIFLNQSLLKM